MNYNDFIKKHNGKGTDYDGRYGVQCVDLVKAYLKEVFSITAGYWGDAHAYYDGFNSHKELTTNFTRIANTPDFIPKKGDIVVWSSKLNNGPGHIAIANGQGDTKTFYSYDQNWTGKHDKCTLVKHNYNCVLGVLRPKNRSKIITISAPFKSGTYTLTTDIKVRASSSIAARQLRRSELTANGKANSKTGVYAVLKSGTKVTVGQVVMVNNKEYWGKIPSGWIALMYNGQKYVNK